MDLETIRRMALARHLYELGSSSLRSSNDLHLFAAANLLQDAVEAFLIAVGEQVGAGIDQHTRFDKYFVAIDGKISPRALPFKLKILRLNNVRVASKHYGIQPDRRECERLAVSVKEFFDEVSASILGVNFSTVSALDLLEDGEIKGVLQEAKSALGSGNHQACAINCRKVLYLEVEKDYDIAQFREGAEPKGLFGGFSHAPYYARNKEYIAKNVKDPVDYIVLDHSRVNQDLLAQGVDTTEFWNIWRLTPSVYRLEDKTWIVKHDFARLEPAALAEKTEYLFNATVDFALAIHADRRRTQPGTYGRYALTLKRENVPVFTKADSSSAIYGHTPPGMTKIDTDYQVPGFDGDGPYWHVMHIGEFGKTDPANWLFGYIHDSEVVT